MSGSAHKDVFGLYLLVLKRFKHFFALQGTHHLVARSVHQQERRLRSIDMPNGACRLRLLGIGIYGSAGKILKGRPVEKQCFRHSSRRMHVLVADPFPNCRQIGNAVDRYHRLHVGRNLIKVAHVPIFFSVGGTSHLYDVAAGGVTKQPDAIGVHSEF